MAFYIKKTTYLWENSANTTTDRAAALSGMK